MSVNRFDHVAQQGVAGRVAMKVIDLFEPVDVDERQHKRGVAAAGSGDFPFQRDHAELAPERAGQLVELGAPQLGPRLLAIAGGGGSIVRGLLAIGAPVLLPSLWLLFRIFKSGRAPGGSTERPPAPEKHASTMASTSVAGL
ncbi:MAG: hypothetical protein NVS1B9_11870 [Solirubrobacteraceae bacterium]